jgi:MFS family permease
VLKLLSQRKIFYGWWVVLACSGISVLGSASYMYGFTVFFLPLSADLNLSRAAASLVFSTVRLEGGLGGPAVGWFIDRFGPGRSQFIGAAITGLGFLLLSRVDSFLTLFLVYALVIGVGFNLGLGSPGMAAANAWFIRRKATAIGMISTGFGIGGVLVPLLSLLVLNYGWRYAVVVVGLTYWLAIMPLSLAVRRSPESMGLRPDGLSTAEWDSAVKEAMGTGVGYADFSPLQALKTPSFWAMAAGMSLFFAVHSGVIVHLVPLLVDKGLSLQTAAGMIALLALINAPMRLAMGWLGDRWPKRSLLIMASLVGSGALALMLFATSIVHIYIFIILWAVAYSCNHLHWSMLGQYYGRKNFAKIRGFADMSRVLLVVSSPVFAGRVYDVSGSYRAAIIVFAGAFVLAALFYSMAKPPHLKDAPT